MEPLQLVPYSTWSINPTHPLHPILSQCSLQTNINMVHSNTQGRGMSQEQAMGVLRFLSFFDLDSTIGLSFGARESKTPVYRTDCDRKGTRQHRTATQTNWLIYNKEMVCNRKINNTPRRARDWTTGDWLYPIKQTDILQISNTIHRPFQSVNVRICDTVTQRSISFSCGTKIYKKRPKKIVTP